MKAEITAKLVRQLTASAPAQEVAVYDTRQPGFVLRVRPSGAHSYAVFVGRGKRVTIGPLTDWSPDKARTEAVAIRQRVAKGEPATAKAAAKESVQLRAFLKDTYEPWLTAHRRRPDRKTREIATSFADLLDSTLAEITPFTLERWRKARLSGKHAVSHATCNRDLAELKAMFSRAVVWGQAKANPVKALKLTREDHGVVRYLTPAEEARLRKALLARDDAAREARASANAWRAERGYDMYAEIGTYSDALAPLVLLALQTGLRRGELLSLTWGVVDLTKGRLTVQAAHAKSGKTRHVPLNSEARTVLTTWRPKEWQPSDLVFPGAEPDAPIVEIKTAWRRLLNAAKITNFRFHDLRHTFASKLVMRGVDLNTVRELLGHADIKMTLRYAHLAPEHLDAAVEKLVSEA